ncbi:MAG TPA: hypothetical protein VGG31_00710 [Candidatus Dormibacteraeota bacterium]
MAASRTQRSQRGLTGTVDDTHIEVDWPKSLGFFGGLGAAIAFDLVPLPIAVFVASVPFLKLLNRPTAPKPQRFLSHVVDGAAKPVGGDAEGTIRWSPGAGRSKTSAGGRRTRPGHSTVSKGGRGK